MKKILIVEDVELNLDLLVQLLEDTYDLVIARDGLVGVKKAISENPDLIIMDMALPQLDGWEATRQIKSIESLNHIPIIGLSSHAMPGDTEKALAAGCDEYLTKPLDESLLFTMLDQYLGN